MTLVSSNDIITIKIDKKKRKKIVKNHKKIQKQIRLFKIKIWAIKGKQTQIMRWKKDNLRIFTLKKMF